MGSPEPLRSFVERDMNEDVEVNIDIVRVDDEWDGVDKRKHKSTKPRKHGSVDDADGSDSSGRKRSTSSSRKRVGGSRKADSDRDDYEARKESRSKQVQKQPEDNILDKLSTLYQDEEPENKFESATKYVSRVYSRGEESERKKPISKYSEHNVGVEKVPDRDLRFSERRDDVSEKGHVYAEHGRKLRKRLDESDNAGKADEYVEKSDVTIGNRSDFKMETVRSRSDTLEYQSNEIKSKVLVPVEEKSIKSHDREQRRADSVRNKRGRSKVPKEANKGNDRSSKERFEEYTQPRNPTRDIIDDSERSSNADVKSSNSARTPEKIVKHQYESDTFRRKERGKCGSWDDRSKERDECSGVRNMEQENFKETWNRRQDKETRENETTCGRDVERPHGRFGRKPDAVKTSSKYGISNENYDVIEIQTKAFDYGRDDSRSKFAASSNVIQQSDTKVDEFDYSREERSRSIHESVQYGEVTKDKFMDGGLSKDGNEFQAEKSRGQKVVESNRGIGGQISGSATLPPYGNQEIGSFNRNASQSVRGNKFGRVGRGRPIARDSQQAGIPMPLVGSPFGPLGVPPPGLMQSLTPNMSPAPGPISHGVFIPSFQPPIIWPGAQGVEMNMLGVPPGLPSVLTGPLGPRFPPNLGNPPSVSVFNPAGPGRGMPSSMSASNFNSIVPAVRGLSQENFSGGWVPPPRTNGPPGKAPSRGEQNDYSQNFVDTGTRPQNFIRELELTSVVEDYPRLRELIQRKDEIVAKSASPPMYYKCDLREHVLSSGFFGTKFDVILIDPPWEEYVHRAPGVTDHMEHWTFEEIMNLKIEAIADTPSFIFLWVGDGVGLEQGRQCLKKWGFRRCEDICWVKTNKTTATPGLRHDSHTLYQHTKEHCLMGIKGTVRRSTDGHIIHANIDTDVIIAEEPPYGSTAKPEDMYRIIEHFALGRRRIELFGEDHNIRSGWLTVGKGLTSSNFNSEGYIRNFADKDGKVWLGGGGRNPPPEAPHLALTTPEIESLRPKSPMKNQQQIQQQQQQSSVAITLTSASSSNKRPTDNSINHNAPPLNQEGSISSNMSSPALWNSQMVDGLLVPDGRVDMYPYNDAPFGPGSGDFMDYESNNRGMNMF